MLILTIFMCVYWLNYYILFIVNWIDWITCWCWEFDELKLIMWIVIEKWWVESEFDDLLEIDWLIDNLIELCLCWELCDWEKCWEMRWELRCWWWKIELSFWDCGFENCWIEIDLMKFVNLIEFMSYMNCMCLMVMSWLF